MSTAQHVVFIIGGAVSGSEAASIFAQRGMLCVVIEQGPRPYGKIEDGLPRWHAKLREQWEDSIDEKLSHPNVLFIPNTRLGRDITLDELRALKPSAVVLASGAWRDRPFPFREIEQFRGNGFYYQNEFVYWFNHFEDDPGYAGPSIEIPGGAIVLGGGLASIDVVKIIQLQLARKALKARGLEDNLYKLEKGGGIKATLDKLKLPFSDLGIQSCTLFYRRRPEDMPLADPPANATEEQVNRVRMTRVKMLTGLKDKFFFHFEGMSSPSGIIVENGRLAGLKFTRNEMADGKLRTVPGSEFEVRSPLIISSIGSIPEPIPGVPMKGETYPVRDENTGELDGFENVFAMGNAVTGRGNIKDSVQHARLVSGHLLENYFDLSGVPGASQESAAAHAQQAASAIAGKVLLGKPVPEGQRAEILARVRQWQSRAGYGGDYASYRDRVRLPHPVEE
ncbi:MAG: hypothetical protein GMKNLPBB_03248 [Myxococcota bacterium]|nr:hypothetical protein [Myxococcota bacterium]